MKKLTITLILMFFSFSFAACGIVGSNEIDSNNESPTVGTSPIWRSDEDELKEYNRIIEKVTDDDYENVITKLTSQQIVEYYLPRLWGISSWMPDFVSINDEYGIELIRKMDDGRMYTINKPESGGLFYCFCVSDPRISAGHIRHTAYVCKKLSISDFDSVEIGDDISIVEAINPATTPWKEYFYRWSEKVTSDTYIYEEIALLTDGLLRIDYQKDEEGTFNIVDMIYNEDFKMIIDFYNDGDETVYDYSILPQDYPK